MFLWRSLLVSIILSPFRVVYCGNRPWERVYKNVEEWLQLVAKGCSLPAAGVCRNLQCPEVDGVAPKASVRYDIALVLRLQRQQASMTSDMKMAEVLAGSDKALQASKVDVACFG